VKSAPPQNNDISRDQDSHYFTQESGFMAWWYRLTAPAEIPSSAPLAQREKVRRGKLASGLSLILLFLLIIVLCIGIVGPNKRIIPAAAIMFILVGLALYLNRIGHTNLAGIILSFGYDAAVFAVILTNQGGLDPSILNLFDMLIIFEIFFIKLLPVNFRWVVFAILFNSVAIFCVFRFSYGSPAFIAMMQTSFIPIIARPLMLHIIVAGVLWYSELSTRGAILRADKAEEIARLRESIEQQKRELEEGVQQISEVLVTAANGRYDVSVPLNHENILWRIASSLNTLLRRLQTSKRGEEALRQQILQLAWNLQNAREHRRPPVLLSDGGPLSPLIAQLQRAFSPAPSTPQSFPQQRFPQHPPDTKKYE
jgi:hypothetical protein